MMNLKSLPGKAEDKVFCCEGCFIQKESSMTELSGFLRELPDCNMGLGCGLMKDPLTNILNRTSIENQITHGLRNMSENDTLCLFMIDLDNFKEVNDKLGHRQGDKILSHVSAVIKKVFHQSNSAGRLGGDEFMAFTVGSINAGLAGQMASKLIKLLQMTVGSEEKVNLSASIGVVIHSGGKSDFNTLYGLADKALYEAKKNGKNRYQMIAGNSEAEINQNQFNDIIHLQTLFQYMDAGVALLELNEGLRLLYISPGCKAIFEDCDTDFTDQDCAALSMIRSEDGLLLREAAHRSAEAGEAVDISFQIQTTTGEMRWIQARFARIPYEDSENPVLIVMIYDITKLKKQEAALLESSERTRIAFNQTAQTLWEMIIRSRKFAVFDTKKQMYDDTLIFPDAPDSLIRAGLVHPVSQASFLTFFDEMTEGKKEDSAAFMMRYFRSNIWGWAKISYHMVFDENGMPLKAIGIMEEMPTIFNEQTRFKQEEALINVLSSGNMELIVANLTANHVKKHFLKGRQIFGEDDKYSTLTLQHIQSAFTQEDAFLFKRFFCRELTEAYSKGTTWVEAEYRRHDSQGNVLWVSCTANLIVEPVTRELYGFLLIKDVDERRKWELSLPSRAEHDPVSHLYSGKTVQSMIASLLKEKNGSNKTCSLAVVDIIGIRQISERMNQTLAEQIRFSIGRLFRVLLDHECVVGQGSDERVLLFWPSSDTPQQVKSRLQDIIATVERVYSTSGSSENIDFSAGISTALYSQADFDGLYARAAYVCDKNKRNFQNVVECFESYAENNRNLMDMSGRQGVLETNEEEVVRPLTPEEKETLLSFLLKMLTASDYHEGMSALLQILGDFYYADRVYQLDLSEDDRTLNQVYEWTAHGKYSLMKHMANLQVRDIPVIKAAMERKQIILLRGPSVRAGHDPHTGEYEWRFICGPIIKEEKIIGFLCVENPRKHYADTALLTAVIPLMLIDGKRKESNVNGRQEREGMDRLTGLEDWRAYIRTLGQLNSDILSSMGVLYLNVYQLSKINTELGYTYGDSLLAFVGSALSTDFPQAKSFRISGGTFVVLYPNVTYPAFSQKCDKVQSVLDGQYPEQVHLGFTWADRNINVKKLVDHAKDIMNYNSGSNLAAAAVSASEPLSAYDLKADIAAGLYTVYIQPKAKLSTEEIVGGESLVRYISPERGIVPPIEFIERMEKENIIRELDFFVLDKTLQIMQGWKERGKQLVQISVNFSRQTLLDRSSLASVLAIHSRYDIPADIIEIEITESIGMIEHKMIAEAVQRFRSQGFKVSLDDFGSDYSSITMLSDVSFDSIKLDKSIVYNFLTNPVSRSIVEGMVKTCEIMGAVCIAEGVETLEQVEALKQAGCDYVQGYYLNKPIPAADFEEKYLKINNFDY
ncbi:EAL domain-containing protein [Lachnospiraceae bacterium 54-53]